MSKKPFQCPKWMTEGVMYQIFPDRFARSRSYVPPPMDKDYILRDEWGGTPNHLPDEKGIIRNNDFFGGNLQGIIEKLPYLQDLGVTVIYLNPIFEAYSNHRYDTANFKKIDPLLGTEDDFRALCSKAKEAGIRIILDGVFNHTGSDSIYFNKYGRYPEVGAYQSKDSPYFQWFQFTDYPDKYESWWGIDTLPHVNETDPGYLDYILNNADSVVRHWLSCGASGFRLDVVDELPDVFLDRFREVVKEYDEDAVIIGEVWEDASTKVSYGQKRRYLSGDQLDSVMNYPLQKGIIDFFNGRITGTRLSQIVEELWRNYPETVFNGLMNILGTHDTPRILTVFEEEADDKKAQQKLFAAIVIWALMPGIPCIYYGDEIGMKGDRDPFNRGCFVPEKGNREIYLHYKKLMAFRKKLQETETLEQLKFQPCNSGANIYSFHRRGRTCRLVVCVCREGEEYLPVEPAPGERIEDFFISGDVTLVDFNTFRLKGCSGVAVLLSPTSSI
ncbi:MAG: glycoside hydrolase family 13 protein [Clostridiales bacterium]|nr:glycoside hydrolase family 13 protein [Clostridiales bacterium]